VTDYATSAELKSTLSLTGESFADADLSLAITAASRAIDSFCQRRFDKDANATSVRYYTPPAVGDVLLIDDLVALTSLAVDLDQSAAYATTWTQGTDFLLDPENAQLNGLPFSSVVLIKGQSFVRVPRSVKITGQFGWPSIPDAVHEATLLFAADLVRRVRQAGAVFGSETIVLSASGNPDVAYLLAPYRLVTVA
jgi:hypothetical protein